MNEADHSEDQLLQTSRGNALLRWDTLLDVQVETFLPYELQFLFSCPAWAGASRVLDAGCGNGYFLSSLSRFFPDKTYVGIDVSRELIDVARNNYARPGLGFELADFFAYKPEAPVDFLFMRLVVQHLQGVSAVLERAKDLVEQGGTLLVVEPDPRGFMNFPPTPVFMGLLQAIEQHGADTSKNRANLALLGQALEISPDWTLANAAQAIVPQVGPFANSHLLEMFLLWIESLESAGEIDFPFDDARSEIEAWAAGDVSYNQIGVCFFQLERK